MAFGDRCKECGTAIPADSPGGFCGQCLLGLGLQEVQGSKSKVQSPGEDGGGQKPEEPETPRIVPVLTEKPGDRIGRYRLLQEIGHGGCGVVYMADQENPVRRKVALKVIKLGRDTKRV